LRTDFQARVRVVNDANTDETITDEFTVSIGHRCSENVLDLQTPTESVTDYVIPSSGDGTAEALSFAGHTTSTTVGYSVTDCAAITCLL
jgi:hypothetical protein